ncbi:MAG: glycosyltransferase [Myxococcota bacterium]
MGERTIINVSTDGGPWLSGRMSPGLPTRFLAFGAVPKSPVEKAIGVKSLLKYKASFDAAVASKAEKASIVVSHLPTMSVKVAPFLRALSPQRPTHHLAFSWNFTELPKGLRLEMFKSVVGFIDGFVVYSTFEIDLYSEYFGIDREKIHFLHWTRRYVHQTDENRIEDYVLAVGRSGRDYATFMDAMRLLPGIRAIVVASKDNLQGLEIPKNVEVRTDIPFEEVRRLVNSARISVIPLKRADAPLGHGALVLGMFARRPMVVSRSPAFDDYVTEGESCLMFGSAQELADSVDKLWSDRSAAEEMGLRAFDFAMAHCREIHAVEWFERYLAGLPTQ